MAGKKGAPDLLFKYDASGGSPVDISGMVLEINGIKVEHLQEESQGYGVAWFESLFSGMNKVPDIVIKGFYDDTAAAVHDLFKETPTSATATRTFLVQLGRTTGDISISVETRKVSYDIQTPRNNLVRFETVLRPTGTVTYGTVA